MDAAVTLRVGEGREVLQPQGPQVERGGASHDLDVLLSRSQLERDLIAWQRTDDVDEQPRRQHDRPLAHHLALERDAQADLHVRRAQFDPPILRQHLHAGEGLDGAACGRRSGDRLQMGKEEVAPRRKLHVIARASFNPGCR